MSIRIVFLRDASYQPVGCVALAVDPGTAQLQYGVSILNPQDRFDRKMARQLAIGRLVEKPRITNMHRNGGELSRHDVTTIVMKDLVANSRQVPTRGVKAAKLWLKSTETLALVPTHSVH